MQDMYISRRHFVQLAGTALVSAPALALAPATFDLTAACHAVERDSGGRYGLAVHDTATGRRFHWRGDERFAMASTFKVPLAAAILAAVDHNRERLDRTLRVRSGDVLGVSPFTRSRVGGRATIEELCRAAMIFSDNGAANLLLPAVGGPAGLTAFLRRTGDLVTRLDRNEPMMSEDLPGEIRDTTSPDAMLATMKSLLVGDVLRPASRQRMIGWMIANTTGDDRLRAGLPKAWRVGDKTGSSAAGSANDIAIIWPPGTMKPLLVASYLSRAKGGYATLGVHHANIARAIVAGMAG